MYVASRPQRFGKRIYELSERTKDFAVMYLPQRKCNSMPNCLCMLSPTARPKACFIQLLTNIKTPRKHIAFGVFAFVLGIKIFDTYQLFRCNLRVNSREMSQFVRFNRRCFVLLFVFSLRIHRCVSATRNICTQRNYTS